MSALPVWLLDLDGVVNAVEPRWYEAPRTDRCFGLEGGWTVRWTAALTGRIARYAEDGLVEVRWATAWALHAHQLGRVLRLPDFPAAYGARPRHKTWTELKAETAVAVVESGRPLVWTDDLEVTAGRQLFPILAAAEARGQALLIEPQARHGLTPEDLRRIEAFLLRHREIRRAQ